MCGSAFLTLNDFDTFLCFIRSDADLDDLAAGCGNVFSNIIRANRKLAVTPVHKNGKLNFCRSAERENGVNGGSCRASGIDNIINKNNRFSVHVKINRACVEPGLIGKGRKVVAIKSDIQAARSDRCAELFKVLCNDLAELLSAAFDADNADRKSTRLNSSHTS